MTEPQRELLQLSLQRLTLLDQHIAKLEELAATVLEPHREAVLRLAQVPGLGVNAAQPIIAEVGAGPAAFASASRLASWAGICPGQNISAEVAHSTRSAKGNRHLWAVLVQAAQAAVKTKHTYRQRQFRRGLPRLGFQPAIWAVAPRLCRLVWKILHDGVSYVEPGAVTDPRTKQHLARKHLKALRRLGYTVALTDSPASTSPLAST